MASRTYSIIRAECTQAETCTDEVVVEAPLALYFLDEHEVPQPLSVTMRTPGHDEELALGLLFAEGLIASADDMLHIADDPSFVPSMPEERQLILRLRHPELCTQNANGRRFASTSSCGVCGSATLDALKTDHLPDLSAVKVRVPLERLYTLSSKVAAAQPTFQRTGGLHAAALFNTDGDLLAIREDIGRHNALDKLVGYGMRRGWWPGHEFIVFMSSRLSFEIVQKTLRAGIPLLMAVSAPSSLAIELAREHGVTLVGFMRTKRCNIYSLGDRITRPAPLLTQD